MNKLKTALSYVVSAAFAVVFFLYIKFISAFVLGGLYFRLPFSFVVELVAVVVAYLLVAVIINRWHARTSIKLIVLGAISLVPVLAARFLI